MARDPYKKQDQLTLLLSFLYQDTEARLWNTYRDILVRNNEIHTISGPTKFYYKGVYYYSSRINDIRETFVSLDPSLEKEMDIYIQDQEDYRIEHQVISAYFIKALNLQEQVMHIINLFPKNLREVIPTHYFATNHLTSLNDSLITEAKFKEEVSPRTLQFISNRLLTNFLASK